jgi:hypothetical protein
MRRVPAQAGGKHRVPRYHFNILDGVRLPDTDGIELPDWHAARLEAVRRAGEILKDEPQSVALGEDWRIEVTDHTGLILFQMTFLMIESPFLRRDDHGRS